MALCVALQPDGSVVPTGQAVTECTGYVLVSGTEHGVYAVVQKVFEFPSTEVALGWFAGCFSLVVFLYVAMRMGGAVANIFNSRS